MTIPPEIVDRIKAVSKLSDVIGDMKQKGRTQYFSKCPKCNAFEERKKNGLIYTPAKEIVKCFQCGWGTNNPITYVMETQNRTYPEALSILADIHNIDIEANDNRVARLEHERKLKQQARKTFRDRQLEESGLDDDDITAITTDEDGTERHVFTFKSGTRDQYANILPGQGDDMLIYYYDLQGHPVMYRQDKTSRMKHLIRVRWQNPELHQDKEGKPKKYESPYGSGSHIYIPEKIRQRYRSSTPIETLFIQEGEKKSEKATKHGIPSIGVMGIQNIGSKAHVLPQDIQLIIQRCETQQVVFMLDADWDELSDKLKPGDAVDQRPRSFFYAVKNYKEYMRTLVNLGVSVEIWFGYVRKNEANAKGIDDLLTMVLKGDEAKLSEDVNFAMHDKDGHGQYVQLHKITQMSDTQIADLWLLNDAEAFATKNKERLQKLPVFKFGKLDRRFNEKGKLELAQPLLPSEQYWEELVFTTRNGDERKELQFDYANCFNFLMNRGFHRVRLKSNAWEFVHIENRVVYKVDNYDIKDYVTEFTKELKRKDVINMLYRGGPQYLGHEKLSNLEFTRLSVEKATRDSQCLFFQDKIWNITADGIQELSYAEFKNHVWEDKVIKAKVEKLPPLIDATRIDDEFKSKIRNDDYKNIPIGEFLYDLSKDGEKCHFLQFLRNASNFIWRKQKKLIGLNGSAKPEDQISLAEFLHDNKHFINKLTAIGYLLHDYKNDSELKAIIGMDGKLSEYGISNGRTGKSIIGKAIEYIIPQVYIPAKSKKITEDAFLFGEVTEKTKNIFLDDVRANIDFEFFFPLITGKLKVNPKGAQPFTLEQEDTPKLYLTTNHAISGEGASFKDRQSFMAFSDFYNEDHKPVDDFGVNFFSEWDNEQWNLFYNLMANCLMLYFRSMREGWSGRNAGIVEPPMENIEQRRLRQIIGEDFIQWADAAFAPNDKENSFDSKLNQKWIRKELFDDFVDKFPHTRKYITSTSFGKRMRCYCKYKKLHFNPDTPNENGMDFPEFRRKFEKQLFEGRENKSGGKEFWTIADDKFTETL